MTSLEGRLTLLKLTSAYSAFVNGGKLVSPILIDRVQDSEGNTILNNEKRTCLNCDQISFTGKFYPEIKNNYKQIFSAQTAYQITSLLEGVVKRGTGKKLKKLNLNLAGKTGTTNDAESTWFTGFNKNILTTVWFGYDQPSTLGNNEFGSTTALPIWLDYMEQIINSVDYGIQKRPPGLVAKKINLDDGQFAESDDERTMFEFFLD